MNEEFKEELEDGEMRVFKNMTNMDIASPFSCVGHPYFDNGSYFRH